MITHVHVKLIQSYKTFLSRENHWNICIVWQIFIYKYSYQIIIFFLLFYFNRRNTWLGFYYTVVVNVRLFTKNVFFLKIYFTFNNKCLKFAFKLISFFSFFIVNHPYICQVLKIFVKFPLVQFYLVFIQFSFALSKKESKFT